MDLYARGRTALRTSIVRYPRLTRRVVGSLHRVSRGLSQVANRLDESARNPATALTDVSLRRTLAEQERWEAFAIYTVNQSQNPIAWLAYAEASKLCEPAVLTKAIDAIINDRNPSTAGIFQSVTSEHKGSATALYAYLRKSEWINAELSPAEIGRIADFIETSKFDNTLRRRLFEALFPLVINSGTAEQLDYLLAQSWMQWGRLAFNRRVLVIRKLATIPGRQAESAAKLEEMRRAATPLERLKLRNFEFLAGAFESTWNHDEAEESFAAAASPGVATDFRDLVKPAYDALRSRMRYMEIRANAEQRTAMLARIETAISSKTRFSCIRLSDREGYLFAETGFFTTGDVKNCENHWWGTELSAEHRAKIVGLALESVSTADIVGIPAIHRFIRDVSATTPSLLASLQSRGLVDVLRAVRHVASRDAEFSEDKVNVGLLGDVDTVAKLATGAHRLIVVTSVQSDQLPPVLLSHPDLHHIGLPTHHKTRLNQKYNRRNDLLPHVYPSIVEQLQGIVEPGALVLVAGGLVGKIFIGRARALGAVALDMGHVVDDWVNNRLPPLR